MAGEKTEAKGRRAIRYSCGAPPGSCMGTPCMDYGKTHGSEAQVLACMRRHILKQGGVRIDSRTFLVNDTYLCLPKHPTRIKPGKTKGGYMARGVTEGLGGKNR